jgi:3-hydroxypropanoate dehydrogenase
MPPTQLATEEIPKLSLVRNGISEAALDTIFRTARTHGAWKNQSVSKDLLCEIYELAKMGPTSANTSPLRVLFLTTEEAKDRLLPGLMPMNVEKSKTAPVVAILAYDQKFYDQLPKLMPYRDIRSWFADDPAKAEASAKQGANLQAAYFIVAARALGLDCGPIGGFDAEVVNKEFFGDSDRKAFMIVNLGYGDESKLNERLPRLDFEEACSIL